MVEGTNGQVEGLKAYYYESTPILSDTIFQYELLDRIQPNSMFITGVERALIKRGLEDGRKKVVNYVPSTFHQAPRLLSEHAISRIVPRLDGPVTTPRIDTHIVVTENGWVDLKGKSSTERALALISLAEPQFQDELRSAARTMHLICPPNSQEHTMTKTVADQMVDSLSAAGVRRIYGIVDDSLNGFTDALRRHGEIDWLHVRHEEVAAFAAGADAAVAGELAVCAGSCGPGNLHLINGLFDCHRSRAPVVAIAAHIPSAEIGAAYFQETHPEQLFRECSSYCELVGSPEQMPRALDTAIRRAASEHCVCVVARSVSDSRLRPSDPYGALTKMCTFSQIKIVMRNN